MKIYIIRRTTTSIQMTIDTSSKAEQTKPAPAATVKQNEPTPAPKAPAQGENVAAIEAKVKAGETINLSDAIKKDKQAAQAQPQGKAAPQTGQTRTYGKGAEAKTEQPSIKEKIAAGKQQLAGQKSAPSRAQNKNAEIGG